MVLSAAQNRSESTNRCLWVPLGAFGHIIASKQHRKTSARALQVHDVVGDACGGGTV